MAAYDPMGLAVPKMDGHSPADMSTVISDTDVTKASTLTMMVTVTTMEGHWHQPQLQPLSKFQVQVQMTADILRTQQVQELCQNLKVYSLMSTNLSMPGMHQTSTRNLGFFTNTWPPGSIFYV